MRYIVALLLALALTGAFVGFGLYMQGPKEIWDSQEVRLNEFQFIALSFGNWWLVRWYIGGTLLMIIALVIAAVLPRSVTDSAKSKGDVVRA